MYLCHNIWKNCVTLLTEVRKLGSVHNAVQTFFLTLPSSPLAHKTGSVLYHGPGASENWRDGQLLRGFF